jgi:hypothetical protein
MDISKLLKKPDLHYTPEMVELSDPGEPLPESGLPYDNIEDDVADTRAALEEEISNVDALFDAVVTALPEIEVEVPEDQLDVIEKPRVTLSDYLESLASDDYGPVAIRDVFEEHVAYQEPAALAVPLLDSLRRSLSEDVSHLSDSMFQGKFDPATGASNDKALFNIRCAISDSQDLREEISRAAWAAKIAIDRAAWAHIISSSERTEFNSKISEVVTTLRRVRSLLKMTTTMYAVDWKSAMTNIRDCLAGPIVDRYLNQMFSACNRAYNKIAKPLDDVMRTLSSSDLHDLPETEHLKLLLGKPIKHLQDQKEEALADSYAIKRKRAGLQINGARAVGALSYTKRLSLQLDAVIAGLEAVTTSGKMSLEAPAPEGTLGKILEDKKVYKISPDTPPIIVDVDPEEINRVIAQMALIPR